MFLRTSLCWSLVCNYVTNQAQNILLVSSLDKINLILKVAR